MVRVIGFVFGIALLGLVVPSTGCSRDRDKNCREAEPCTKYGRCSKTTEFGAMACAATSDEQCAKSTVKCKEFGQCAAGPKGECIAKTEAHCRKSDKCRIEGLCSLKDTYCIAMRRSDCRKSENCRLPGRNACTLGDGSCYNRHMRD